MELEWDERKRLRNLVKHGLDFRRAVEVFSSQIFTERSQRLGEERWITVGSTRGQLVAIIWTDRGGIVRIISMRKARREERRRYRDLFG